MKKLRVFGLAAVLLLASSVLGTPRAMAQGPWTPQSIVDAFVKKGGKITEKTIQSIRQSDGSTIDMCVVAVEFFNVFVPTSASGGGYGSQNVAAEIGMEELQFLNMTNATINNDGKDFRIKMFFDPSFCNPPSGTSPAQNLVPDPVPNASHDSTTSLVVAALVLAGGFLPFRRVFVRI